MPLPAKAKHCLFTLLLLGAQTSAAQPIPIIQHDVPTADVELSVVVAAGLTSSCGYREAPHLIEHLLLSNTVLGETPVDAILNLEVRGIELSAVTRSDFTEFTVSGPASQSTEMVDALAIFLGQPSIPKMGFEREKNVIISELRQGPDYRSSPSLFDRFVAVYAGGLAPCAADSKPLLDYEYEEIQKVYSDLYTQDAFTVNTKAPAGTFDLEPLVKALQSHNLVASLDSHYGPREAVVDLEILGRKGMVEVIFPIAGRSDLSNDTAQRLADHVRLKVQSFIRKDHQLYTARTFVDQNLVGGWLRLEVPNISDEFGIILLDVAAEGANEFMARLERESSTESTGLESQTDLIGKQPLLILSSVDHSQGFVKTFFEDLFSFFKALFG